MPTFDFNWWAILGGVVISMAIGTVWYMPAVFGKAWTTALGKKAGEMGNPGPAMLLALLASVVLVYVMAHFVRYTGATTFATGAQTGFWLWLGIAATTILVHDVFEGRPSKLFWINSMYHLVQFVLIGGVLAMYA